MQNGLQIRPFRKAHQNMETDRELVNLTEYLLLIGDMEVRPPASVHVLVPAAIPPAEPRVTDAGPE
jgi:hypothetical protein